MVGPTTGIDVVRDAAMLIASSALSLNMTSYPVKASKIVTVPKITPVIHRTSFLILYLPLKYW